MRRSLIPLALLPALPAIAETEADIGWHLLGQIELDEVITENSYAVHKTFPSEIAGGDPEFEVSGYLVPTDWAGREFLLVSDLSQCPYCGTGDHGLTVNVTMADAAPEIEEGQRVVLRGALFPVHDPETFQAVILRDAVRIDT